jgi:hypothetical protein
MALLAFMLKVMTDILSGAEVAQHLLHSNQMIACPCRNSEDCIPETLGLGSIPEDILFLNTSLSHNI